MTRHYNIKVWAEFHSRGIFDYTTGFPLRQIDIDLPESIWLDLRNWCSSYEFIIPLSFKKREAIVEKISALDKEGLRIRDEIRKICPTNFQIHYYSEGLSRYIGEENIQGLRADKR